MALKKKRAIGNFSSNAFGPKLLHSLVAKMTLELFMMLVSHKITKLRFSSPWNFHRKVFFVKFSFM